MTLTRAFEIMQHEVTIGDWKRLGFTVRETAGSRLTNCPEDDCPIGYPTWAQTLEYANALSLTHDPPLQPCYVLDRCETELGNYKCSTVSMNAQSVYDCEGYRLPTRAEWQYAARAGTTTSYYSGDIAITELDEQRGCPEDPNLNPIAWYCFNSDGMTHPVGLKLPNAWGLYDILGNVEELLHDRDLARSPAFPAVDPHGELGDVVDGRPSVGGSARGWPSLLRIASGLQASPNLGNALGGIRLARTLAE